MSLLDAGIHSDHPSVIIDSEAMFSEDMFGYSTLRGGRSEFLFLENHIFSRRSLND